MTGGTDLLSRITCRRADAKLRRRAASAEARRPPGQPRQPRPAERRSPKLEQQPSRQRPKRRLAVGRVRCCRRSSDPSTRRIAQACGARDVRAKSRRRQRQLLAAPAMPGLACRVPCGSGSAIHGCGPGRAHGGAGVPASCPPRTADMIRRRRSGLRVSATQAICTACEPDAPPRMNLDRRSNRSASERRSRSGGPMTAKRKPRVQLKRRQALANGSCQARRHRVADLAVLCQARPVIRPSKVVGERLSRAHPN